MLAPAEFFGWGRLLLLLLGVTLASGGAGALAISFMTAAAEFRWSRGKPDARRVLKASIAHVPALITVLVADRDFLL